MKQTSARRNVYWGAIIGLLACICCYSHSSWAKDTAGGDIIAEPIEATGFYSAPLEKEVDPDHLKPTEQHEQTITGSYVNHLTRSYSTGNPGLSMKVPGGSFSLNSSYEKGSWGFGSARSGMNGQPFGQSGLGFHEICGEYGTPIITSIIKDGRYNYNLPPENFRKVTHYDPDGNILSESCEYVGDQVYIHEGEKQAFLIRKTDDGYRWEDKYGNWQLYGGKSEDAGSGQMLSSGNRRGKTEQALYDAEHKLLGYADRDGNQVVWVEYTGDLISAVRDSANRRIEYTYDGNGRLWKVKDVLGHETEYLYDADDRLITVNKPGGRESHITYNDYGDVASVLNADGNGYYFEFDYDKTKQEYYALVRSTSGRIKEIWYDEEGDTRRIDINGTTVQTIVKDGNALIITDERGLQTRKEYDEWDNLKKIIYPDNAVVSYQYDLRFNRRSKVIDERGVVTEYEYDEDGNLITQTEAVGTDVERVTEYTYYADGNPETIIIHLDDTTTAVTRMEYDAFDNLTRITDPENNVMQFTSYDEMGNVLTMLDGRGKEWTYGYDNMGRLISVMPPGLPASNREYDAAGNLWKSTDANGQTTTYTYDLSDNLTQIEDAAGNLTKLEYNTDGDLIRQIDPEGKEIRYEYDLFGRQVKIIDGNGNEIRMEYSDFSGSGASCASCSGRTNQPNKIIYPTFEREFRYDVRGRKIEEIDHVDAEILTTTFSYDPAGNLIARTDTENQTTTYVYDAMNRLTTVTDPVGQPSYTYNALGNLTTLTDAKNQKTRFEYDKNGRLKKEIRPMNQQTLYNYNEAGNLIEKLDAKAQRTIYIYDDAGRLEQIAYHDGKTVTFTYDHVGNLKTYDDGVTSAVYDYNALNRKTFGTVNYGAFSKTFAYDYYANSLKKTFTMPDNTAYNYTYNNNNQLTSVSIPGLGEITYPSYTWIQPDSEIYPGGGKHEYSYDPLMRIKQILAKDPGGNPVLDYSYIYDKIGKILSKATEQGTYNYTYDALHRLTDVEVDVPDVNNEAFTYDAVGSRKSEARVDSEWNYNENNELLTFADVEYVYDDNGNMTQKKVGTAAVNYIYNAADRLVKVEDDLTKTVIAEYYYDPFGRRLWKEVGGIRTYFFYADEGLVGEYSSSGTTIRSYGYRPHSTWTTDPLFLKQGDDYYFYQNDHLGTPQKLIGINGVVVWSSRYSALGKTEVQIETMTNNLRFPGQYYDEETGFHYNWFRYYDPRIGRYLRTDPIGFGGGDVNLYGYVWNNSVNVFDPYGLIGYRLRAVPGPKPDPSLSPVPTVPTPSGPMPVPPPVRLEPPGGWAPPYPGIIDVMNIYLGNPFDNSGGVSCRWRAVLRMGVVYYFPYAGGGLGMEVESECCKGKRVRGRYWTILIGLGYSYLGWPIENLEMTAEFLGPSPPSKHDPVGWFSYGASGFSIGPGGRAATIVTTGELIGYSVGGVVGIDFGLTVGEAYFGYTVPIRHFIEEVDCCDESDSKPIRSVFGDI